jgi:hypothetical protein
MENISLVTWDDVFMLDKNLAAEWGYVVDSINIHEMAHRLRPLGSLSFSLSLSFGRSNHFVSPFFLQLLRRRTCHPPL